MSINGINNANEINLSGVTNVSQYAKTAAAEKQVSEKNVRQDTFEKSKDLEKDNTGIYSRESILEELRNSEEQRVKAFQETIKSMLAKQGETVNLTFRGMDLHVTQEQSDAAKKSIEAGGEYSVENVTDRIMKMAKALAGDDPTKIDTLRNAVEKGFKGAMGLLGKKSLNEMPEITGKTYDSVMKQFDEWKSSYNKETEENVNVDNNVAAASQAVQYVKVTA